ncbi:MAG: EpsI family protein [Acidobacteriaceae bacterium]|nr:EpsI family protein [Acidobacteriaceae bacterium]
MLNVFRGRAALIGSILLLSQAAVFYGFSRGEKTPAYRPLDQFPKQIGAWQMTQQGVMEPEIKDILRADDYITRFYANPQTHQIANLFVAFFKTQRYGQQPHSPKNCLPGGGWIWTVSDTIGIQIPGRAQPMQVNRYIVQKAEQKSLVLYWYQSRDRVVASDYMAKVYVVADALRFNRTDTSLVRIWIPVAGDEATSTATAVSFAQAFFQPLSDFLPK